MHPELLSLALFMFVTSCSPGPNNIVASYSGFNFGILKTVPHMLGVIFGFTVLVTITNFGLINVFQKFPIIQEILKWGRRLSKNIWKIIRLDTNIFTSIVETVAEMEIIEGGMKV